MHEDDAQRALRAAKEAYRQLEKMDLRWARSPTAHLVALSVTQSQKLSGRMFLCISVCRQSIGVTTGTAFCGVVGHLLRHEYTGVCACVYAHVCVCECVRVCVRVVCVCVCVCVCVR